MNIKTITTAALLLCAAVGCKENDIAFYSEAPRLEYASVESCTFNDKDYLNAYILDEKTPEKECMVTVQLIGHLLDEPRTFCMQGAVAQKSEYDVKVRFENPYTFPTETATTEVPIYVTCPTKEQASLRTTSKTGLVEISSDSGNPAHQFGPGRNEHLVYTLDVELKIYPNAWDVEWWGTYSTAKYFFIMETLKATIDQIEKTQANQVKLIQAYDQYTKEHGALLVDDDGNEIRLENFIPLQ